MGNIKKFYFDVETTGVNYKSNAIIQIAALIEIDGKVVQEINWNVKPFEGAVITKKALEVNGCTEEQIMEYPDQRKVYEDLLMLLYKHVDQFNPRDKLFLCGYNNRYFDDRFLRAWFERNEDIYFGSWFWADSLDVMVITSDYLKRERNRMKNFKLATVAQYLGVKVDSSKLHDALYDVYLTRAIYKKIESDRMLM